MTRASTPSNAEKPKVSRKSHRKSRRGCDNCKRRRIKCNEQWPKCSNCIKHSDQCSFATQATPPSHRPDAYTATNVPTLAITESLFDFGLSSQASSPVLTISTPESSSSNIEPNLVDPRLQLAFSLTDLELLHNFQTSTYLTVTNVPNLQNFMQVQIPRLGFEQPFVLHCILATSALHMAYFKKDLRDFYVAYAEKNYGIALRAATSLLPRIDVDNCPGLYMFASFCSTYTMAVGPKKGDFLLFSDNGPAEWRILFKGVRAIIEANPWLLRTSSLSPMFELSIRQINTPNGDNVRLHELQEHIVQTASDDPNFEVYLKALKDLQACFPADSPAGARGGKNATQLAFVWLYKVNDAFVLCLQKREPIALVIFGHFCVLLHDMSSYWWIQGWVDHLMTEIHKSLNGEHSLWMRWPIEEIGWIPR